MTHADDPKPVAAAELARDADQVIDTSCAQVFLKGGAALKVKKPVDFGFLDFSTLEKRRWALERELKFNLATAPDIYRAVRRLTRAADGGIELDGDGALVDYALEMRRFDPHAVLSEQPQALTGELAETLGRTIARSHIAAEVNPEGGGVRALGYTIRTNAEHLRALKDQLGEALVETVVTGTDAAFARLSPLLEARRAAGFARHSHGDLHLGNILLEGGRPIPFDCIEFNDLLSEIDTLYDLAFLLMDLCFRDRAEAANRVLNAYLDEAARGMPQGLLEGLEALPLMLSARASVRAHVAAYQGETGQARAYLAAAAAHLQPAPAKLLALGGVSGTGKTTLARKVAPALGAAPGAVILRSDEVRKRLAGLGPTDPAPADAYGREQMQAAYAVMLGEAERALRAGRAVILDATYMDVANREAAQALATRLDVAFDGIWLTAPAAVLEARVAARQGDASDATVEVLRGQLARGPGALSWRQVDTTHTDKAAQEILGGD
ncbi:AAA family ATPase [Caulobacter sp. KR2-114]|uniref:bifunctional aminoglycoside phosphotransferase/ATP-binding protein n=1 Tax=Caulobacter sp. KR2-114 TaxID=3400912 RepID=UPI003C019405